MGDGHDERGCDSAPAEAVTVARPVRFQKMLSNFELLIIDELGFVPLSKTGAELLFEVFSGDSLGLEGDGKCLKRFGGPEGIRTLDLFHAMEARSQLRHRPTRQGLGSL